MGAFFMDAVVVMHHKYMMQMMQKTQKNQIFVTGFYQCDPPIGGVAIT